MIYHIMEDWSRGLWQRFAKPQTGESWSTGSNPVSSAIQRGLMGDIVRSPCISICKLDKHNICVGCFRSVNEIRNWYTLDNDGKKKILENVEQRKVNK